MEADVVGDRGELGGIDGFHLESNRAEFGSTFTVLGIHGAGQNDYGQLGERRLGLQPCQDVETIVLGKFEVEQDEDGEWKGRAVVEGGYAREVIHCFPAVNYVDNAMGDAGSAEELLSDERVVRVIFDQQNNRGFRHEYNVD